MAKRSETAVKVMSAPLRMDLEITSRCNLRCAYCYYYDNPKVDYRDLPTETWLNFFDELARMSVFHVTLQGGEPFLREDFSELIHGIVRNRMRFSILSNGTLITDPIAEVIAGTRRCDSVQVSIDGATPQVHDAFRGDGSLVRALEGLRTLQRHGIPVAARTTVHRRNVHELHGIARLLLDDLGLDAFSTNSAGYLGSCRLQAREIVLTLEERQTAMETFLELSREYPGRISASAGPLAEARLWKDMEEARLQGAPPTPGGGALTACGCPWNSLAVRADGMMIPCTMLPGEELGRIGECTLKDVWRDSPFLNRFRLRYRIPLETFPFCRDCPYVPYCTGNCPGLASSLTGSTEHPSPDACLNRYLKMGGHLPDPRFFDPQD